MIYEYLCLNPFAPREAVPRNYSIGSIQGPPVRNVPGIGPAPRFQTCYLHPSGRKRLRVTTVPGSRDPNRRLKMSRDDMVMVFVLEGTLSEGTLFGVGLKGSQPRNHLIGGPPILTHTHTHTHTHMVAHTGTLEMVGFPLVFLLHPPGGFPNFGPSNLLVVAGRPIGARLYADLVASMHRLEQIIVQHFAELSL